MPAPRTERPIRIGYARTSTARQELASQLEALHRAECHKVFKEQIERNCIREKTLEGQVAAAAKGNHGGMLTFAVALKDKGVPVPEIAHREAELGGLELLQGSADGPGGVNVRLEPAQRARRRRLGAELRPARC
ncbi:hypothetical protein [Streptomyces sp. NPDC050428]|uniref:hypothetical protein n=1 Tax=Streptomyces sp. NPDC050428 TaxID=3155757 RepID=UPI0034216A0E